MAKTIRTIVIDDEAKGRSSLIKLLALVCPNVQVVADFGDPEEVLRSISAIEFDLLLLDINMPGKNGFELLDVLKPFSFQVVFITAHSEYAVQAFKYSAVDYLLKPVDPDELVLAINKIAGQITEHIRQDKTAQVDMLLEQMSSASKNELRKIVLSSQEGLSLEPIDSILYCESQGSYSLFHFQEKRNMLVSRPLGDFEELLTPYNFFRIHRQYLINMRHIQKVLRMDGGYVLLANGAKLEISRRNRDNFYAMLEKLYI